ADQVSISNSISSLRFLSTTDWREFVEQTSIVEQTLRRDPAGVYASMDFHTRDNYRHVVERIAKKSEYSEQAVAELTVQYAGENYPRNTDRRTTHVGYYLQGAGLRLVERTTGTRLSFREQANRLIRRIPFLIYAGAIVIITVLLSWVLVSEIYKEGFRS